MSTVQQVLDIARSQLGTHETPPGSNVTVYGQDYGLSPASWCAEFACAFVWTAAGLPVPATAQSPKGWASCGFFRASAQAAGWLLSGVGDVRPGDYVLYAWVPADIHWPDHVGIVEDVYAGGTVIQTIEGNASGPDGVGDEVARHVRPLDSTVVAIIRPPYDGAPASSSVGSPPPAAPVARTLEPPHPRLTNGVVLVQNGGHHDLVGLYQTQMAKRGWKIAVDGIFGPDTLKTTRAFQIEKGLQIDGQVGPQTWNAAYELPVTP